MSGAVNVKDKRSDWDRFVRGLKNVSTGPRSVVTGIQQGTKTAEGIDVAEYGIVNEMGAVIRRSGNNGPIRATVIPSRPFMRMYFDNNLDKIERFSENALTQVMFGRTTAQRAFTAIGLYTQTGIKSQIRRSGDYVPNSDATIKAKGSARPLIDHAILLNGVSFELRRE